MNVIRVLHQMLRLIQDLRVTGSRVPVCVDVDLSTSCNAIQLCSQSFSKITVCMDISRILYQVLRLILNVGIGSGIRLIPVRLHVNLTASGNPVQLGFQFRCEVIIRVDIVCILHKILRLVTDERVAADRRPVRRHVYFSTGFDSGELLFFRVRIVVGGKFFPGDNVNLVGKLFTGSVSRLFRRCLRRLCRCLRSFGKALSHNRRILRVNRRLSLYCRICNQGFPLGLCSVKSVCLCYCVSTDMTEIGHDLSQTSISFIQRNSRHGTSGLLPVD